MSSSAMNTDFVRRTFEKIDKNHDGVVTLDELQLFLEKLGFAEFHAVEELEPIVGKQSLDLDEFSRFYDAVLKDESKNKAENDVGGDDDDDIVRAFKVFDVNGDGYISTDELRMVLDRLGLCDESKAEDFGRMIRAHDKNLDGLIDLEEFKNMILHDK